MHRGNNVHIMCWFVNMSPHAHHNSPLIVHLTSLLPTSIPPHLLHTQAKQWVDAAGNPAQMQRVVSLQLEAFWQRHSRKILALGGVLLVYMLWRTIFGMAKVFINLSDTVAASGFMVRTGGVVVMVMVMLLLVLYCLLPMHIVVYEC